MTKSRRPTSHKEYFYSLPCEGKNQYSSEKEAQGAADYHMLENMNVELEVYQCNVCSYWHMTRKDTSQWRKEMPKQ